MKALATNYRNVWKTRYTNPHDARSGQGYRYESTHYWSERYLRRLISRLQPTIGDAADIGCGSGKYVEVLDKLGFQVTGIDYSPSLVASAKEKLQGRSVQIREGSFYDLPLPNNSQHLVISMGVLQHIDDIPRALRETHRVLRSGGHLLFETRNAYSLFRGLQWWLRGEKYRSLDRQLQSFSPWGLRSCLLKAGFDRVQLHGAYVFPAAFGIASSFVFRSHVDRIANQLFSTTNLASHNFWISAIRAG